MFCPQVGEVIGTCGQIALVPGTMQLVEGGARRQCALSLRHLTRVIRAVHPRAHIRSVVQVQKSFFARHINSFEVRYFFVFAARAGFPNCFTASDALTFSSYLLKLNQSDTLVKRMSYMYDPHITYLKCPLIKKSQFHRTVNH